MGVKRVVAGAAMLCGAIVLLAPSGARAALGDCGQPVSTGASPTASDCLYVLMAGVGSATCDCVCDTDGSGSIVASDALRCLKIVVGQPFDLDCPCSVSTTTTLPPVPGFQITSPAIEIQPGEESTICYYFRTPNGETLGVNRWASSSLPGTAQVIVFLTVDNQGDPVDRQPPGTLSTAGCGVAGGTTLPQWLYAAQTSAAEITFPIDDGAGNSVAMEIPPNSAGYILMHNLNVTDTAIQGGVTLNAEALATGSSFTESATFVTYNGNISIPPQTSGHEVSQTCSVPADASFWWMSTHTHNHSTHTEIAHGATKVFESTDWENPGAQVWPSAPFFTFDPDNLLTHRCTYDNFTNQTISSGDSYVTDEQCMAITYFFPATTPLWCVDGFGPL
jgi:hypothetical protein